VHGEQREEPVDIPGGERGRHHLPVWMARSCGEDIVAKGAAAAVDDPGWVVEEGFEVARAALWLRKMVSVWTAGVGREDGGMLHCPCRCRCRRT
jgi:hypothetical protein